MGAGYHGGFGKTKGTISHNKNLCENKQERHIVGSQNYIAGRSIFTGTLDDARELLKEFVGKGVLISTGKERVDFEKVIGYYVDKVTGEKYATTIGIIHTSKKGSHIVPARPINNKEN